MSKILVLLKYSQDEVSFFDQSALECALSIPDSEVTVLSMLPISKKEKLEDLTRLGLNVILVSDPMYALSDTYATSKILSKAISKIEYDYIFMGKQSTDGDTGQVPSMISSLLNIPLKAYVKGMNNNHFIINDEEIIPTKNTIYVFERFLTLRFPGLFSSKREITIWDNSTLLLDKNDCGLAGSLTRVLRNYENNQDRRFAKEAKLNELDNLIRGALSISRNVSYDKNNNKVESLIYFGNIEDKAKEFSNNIHKIDDLNKTDEEIIEEIKTLGSKLVIFEDSLKYKMLSSRLSCLLKAGLCADCIDFRQQGNDIVLTRPAFGGNIIADIVCTTEYSLATVKPISNSSDVIFTVGKGAIKYIDKIKELARKYNAEVCSTRDLVDLGHMPYSAQVGLTGKFVYPKVYVTFGVSGAVQHTCGISGSGTIISINNDPRARIFTYSDYKIVDDITNIF